VLKQLSERQSDEAMLLQELETVLSSFTKSEEQNSQSSDVRVS
jgi:hypothetical protein